MWIDFDGILNVRDLGGIPAADGRRVKPGRLLRGAGLESASDADLAILRGEYRLRHIVDFRDGNELMHHPDRPVPGAEYHSLPALPGLPVTIQRGAEPDFDPVFALIYRQLASSEESAAAYREFFRILLGCGEGAVYFHCTQGKDRTGIAAILALTALGAPRDDVLADYFLSNVGLKEAMEHPESPGSEHWSRETKEKLFFVFQKTLDVYLDCLQCDWGGLDGYLRGCLGLSDADFARLRDAYLE